MKTLFALLVTALISVSSCDKPHMTEGHKILAERARKLVQPMGQDISAHELVSGLMFERSMLREFQNQFDIAQSDSFVLSCDSGTVLLTFSLTGNDSLHVQLTKDGGMPLTFTYFDSVASTPSDQGFASFSSFLDQVSAIGSAYRALHAFEYQERTVPLKQGGATYSKLTASIRRLFFMLHFHT